MPKFINLSGKKFGRLTVLSLVDLNKPYPCKHWECLCECGKRVIVNGGDLKSGHTKSCGCLSIEKVKKRLFKHGQSNKRAGRTPEYEAWSNMRRRCYEKTKVSRKNYFERGIVVCNGWVGKDGFIKFYTDMGKRPSCEHSIDRINNDGNYSCGNCDECIKNKWDFNCRWATNEQQSRNRTDNVWVEHNGEKMIAEDWAKKLNIGSNQIRYYLKKGKTFDFIINRYTNGKK